MFTIQMLTKNMQVFKRDNNWFGDQPRQTFDYRESTAESSWYFWFRNNFELIEIIYDH